MGEKFFIIINGLAKIYIPIEFALERTKENVLRYREKYDTLLIPSSDPNVENWDFYETIDFNEETNTGNFKIRLFEARIEAKKGSAFGELSLITNKPRAAKIVATVETDWAVLTRKDYEKIIQPIEERMLNDKITFLKSFPFLQHLSKQILSKLTYSKKEIVFNRGNTVYQEGDKSQGIYLVYEGEFQVYKRWEIDKIQNYQRLGNYARKLMK